jgi:hypothetical protein
MLAPPGPSWAGKRVADPLGGARMSLRGLGNIGEFAGAVAVLVSPLYLALENLNGRPVGSRLEESS